MIWITAAIVGIVVGYIAILGVSSEQRMNAWLAILFGIIGALAGTWFFFYPLGLITSSASANFWLTVLWSIIGAVIVITIADSVIYISSRRGRDRVRSSRAYPHEYTEKKYKSHRSDKNDEDNWQ